MSLTSDTKFVRWASPILAVAQAERPSACGQPCTGLAKLLEASQVSPQLFVYDPKRSDAELILDLRGEIERQCQEHRCTSAELVIGGFSRGARIAAMLAKTERFAALLCLGYPFHKRGAPKEQHGLQTLQKLQVPTLILQGTRDAHGNREQVRGYRSLPPSVQMHWLENGNHRWQVPKAAGASSSELIRSAAKATVAFLRADLSSARDD